MNADPIPRNDTLKARASKGVFLTLVGYGGSQLIRLISNLVLTRLLFQEAFGIMALAGVLLQGLQLFSDIGVGPILIQSPRAKERKFVETAFSLQAFRGLVLCLISFLVAWPFSLVYNESKLIWVIPIVGMSALMSGFNSVKLFTLNRDLAFGRIIAVELISQFFGSLFMLLLAYSTRSVLALAIGGTLIAFLKAALSHVILNDRPSFKMSKEYIPEFLSFGRWIFVSTIMTFLAGQTDRLIFGKLASIATLGVYTVALTLASFPQALLSELNQKIVYPVLSRLSGDENFSLTFRNARRPFVLIAAYAVCGLFVGGESLVRFLYDERYASAGWMLQVLMIGIWFLLLELPYSAAALALGRPRAVAISGAAKVLGMIVCIPIGYKSFGFPGAVCGYALSETARYLSASISVYHLGLYQAREDLFLSLRMSGVAALGYFGWQMISKNIQDSFLSGYKLNLLGVGFAFVFVTACFSYWLWPLARTVYSRKSRNILGRSK